MSDKLYSSNLVAEEVIAKGDVFQDTDEFGSPPENTQWERVGVIIGNDYKIWDTIGPNDIQQGACGDCWFLAAIAAIAEKNPDLIMKTFVTQEFNHQGFYQFDFFINGVPVRVHIDDALPTPKNRPGLAMARSRNNEIWVPLLEKAFAKCFKSY